MTSKPTGRLAGKVGLITGLARGQGRSHAIRMASEGARIIGIDICDQLSDVPYLMANEDDLRETVAEVEAVGGQIVARVGDVRERASLEEAISRGLEQFGRLDFVIANAGVMPIYGKETDTMDAWHLCLDVLLTGVLNTVEASYPHIVNTGDGGSIILVSSMAALTPMMRTEGAHTLGMLGYSAAKLALISLARNYASLLAEHRIRANTVHPTGVNTPMVANASVQEYFKSGHSEDLRVIMNAIPVPVIDPLDVSNLMVWLCSDEARYFTGNWVRMDAGASLR